MAISLVRAAARASSMLATLAAAISSTEPERRHDDARSPEHGPPRDRKRQSGGRFHDQRGRAARLLLIDATRDHREICPHLHQCRIVAPPADQCQPAHVRVVVKILFRLKHAHHRRGGKERRFGHVYAVEPDGGDANNGDVASVQEHRLVEDLRIAAEGGLPERVTQHHDGRRAWRAAVGRREAGADGRRHSEHVEVVARDENARRFPAQTRDPT